MNLNYFVILVILFKITCLSKYKLYIILIWCIEDFQWRLQAVSVIYSPFITDLFITSFLYLCSGYNSRLNQCCVFYIHLYMYPFKFSHSGQTSGQLSLPKVVQWYSSCRHGSCLLAFERQLQFFPEYLQAKLTIPGGRRCKRLISMVWIQQSKQDITTHSPSCLLESHQ